MRLTSCLTWAAALTGSALGRPAAQAESAIAILDPETGFTFSEFRAAYSLSANIAFRIAVPSTAVQGQPYDVVLQVIAPSQLGWAGLAWAGSMIRNPLTVGWANGQQAQYSSRWATAHAQPSAYPQAQYQRLTTGNTGNGTHFKFTVKCTGCTTFQGSSSTISINPKGNNRLALVTSTGKPSNPSSNTTNLAMHDSPVYWTHDFSQGANANFAELVRKNGGTTNSGTANGTI